MRRRTRRNKNPSVGGPLWNPLFHPTRPAASPRRPTVKVNAAPEVQGTACAPHRSQLERRVPVVPSWCCGPELHVSSEVPALPLGAGTATAQTLGARSARWKLILSILILATPRRQTRRSSGMFDSDRGSNGEWSQPCVCYGGFFSTFLKRGLVFWFFLPSFFSCWVFFFLSPYKFYWGSSWADTAEEHSLLTEEQWLYKSFHVLQPEPFSPEQTKSSAIMTVFIVLIKSSTSILHHPAEQLIIHKWQQHLWYF